MRTRSKVPSPETQGFAGQMTQTWHDRSNPYMLWQTSGLSVQELSQTMTDRKTPGYFRAQREGKIIPVSPMTSRKVECLFNPGSIDATWYYHNRGYWSRRRLQASGVALWSEPLKWLQARVPAPSAFSRDDALLQSALARAQTDAWDTATFLAELGKTVQSFTTLHGRVMRLYSDYQRKLFQKKHWNPETAASLWLEMRYAWRPLLYDIEDINRAVVRLQKGLEEPLCRGWATDEVSASPQRSPTFQTGMNFWNGTLTANLTPTGGSSGLSDGGLMVSGVASAITTDLKRATVGVQVTTRVVTMFDPFVTAWELVPYSFILDWVISTGDLIAAFSPFATGHFRYATYSVERTTELRFDCTVTPVTVSPQTWVLQSGSPFHSQYSVIVKDYQRMEASVTPTLALQLNFDWAKILDLVALAIGVRSRFFNPGLGRPQRSPKPFRYRPKRPRNLPLVNYKPTNR